MADATFIPVTPEQIPELAELAREIWFEYWPDRIGADQTAYMVERFQSERAIREAMAEDAYEYWFVAVRGDGDGERIVGYTGGHVEPETDRFFVSKVYVREEERGKGYGSAIVRFYGDLCRERGLRALYLTVNKGNDLAIRAYDATGFQVIDKVVTDIGHGFVMDDYIMELAVERATE